MAFINQKKQQEDVSAKDAHLNWMGGHSWDVTNPIVRLRMAASSCFFGEPQYYHTDDGDKRAKREDHSVRHSNLTPANLKYLRETLDALDPQEWRDKTPAQLMEDTIDEALAFDAKQTLQEAVRLRNEEHIRTTPQVILVRAAHHKSVKGTGLVRVFAEQIIRRADESAVGLAYHTAKYGKNVPIPNSLKKAWADALVRCDEYNLAKYRMESREVKTVDVMNLCHPGGYRGQAKTEAIAKLAKGELKTTGETWEAIVSEKGSSKEAWTEALDKMGHMALLRNLRNLLKAGVEPKTFVTNLKEGAATGKQLPFRYFSAFKAVENFDSKDGKKISAPAPVLDAIEECLTISMGNMPQFKGRVMSLCDNSGSAWGVTTSSMGTMRVAEIANLQGIVTGMCSEDGHIGIFGDRLETKSVRKKSSVFDQLKWCTKIGNHDIGHSTENGIWLFWDKAIREKEHWDSVFVFSDMQAGHGGLFGTDSNKYKDFVWSDGRMIDVPKLINAYRAKVNKDVKVFLVQVAGYKDTIVPEYYKNTYILGGWGEGLLRFAAAMGG